MNTSTVTPPPGFRIIPREWLLTHPLPKDAIYLTPHAWITSAFPGFLVTGMHTYATALPLDCFTPPPDFRALCEELSEKLAESQQELKAFSDDEKCDHSVGICWCGIFRLVDENADLLTRANAALKGEK